MLVAVPYLNLRPLLQRRHSQKVGLRVIEVPSG
jgi:hypothetical protein